MQGLHAGYPFDMPVSGSNVLTYAALSYHLPLLIAFSLQEETHFVWGGFMLVPLHEMLHDQYDIMKVQPVISEVLGSLSLPYLPSTRPRSRHHFYLQ